jgi:VIT1/CCC1 family predicted Fe2+/Mn2+ transporter
MVNAAIARSAVFGLADGMMSLLGVVLYLLGHQSLIFPAALSGGISSALSMAGGEWLSDSDSSINTSCAMGAATGAGAIIPAIPYAVAKGPIAVATSVTICVLIGLAVALLRVQSREPDTTVWPVIAITFGMLGAIFVVVLVCGLFLPGSAA